MICVAVLCCGCGFHKAKYISEDEVTSGKYVDGVEYVDLGLSVCWATCNLGAHSPSETGDFYAWGEVRGARSDENFDKSYYDNPVRNAVDDFSGDKRFDAARSCLGKSWRMPTRFEIQELLDKCEWKPARIKLSGYGDQFMVGYKVVLHLSTLWQSILL